jgi:hypothetical protein
VVDADLARPVAVSDTTGVWPAARVASVQLGCAAATARGCPEIDPVNNVPKMAVPRTAPTMIAIRDARIMRGRTRMARSPAASGLVTSWYLVKPGSEERDAASCVARESAVGNPADFVDGPQVPWLCDPASRRVCSSRLLRLTDRRVGFTHASPRRRTDVRTIRTAG